jgi:6-phosphogluconolactonase/glucosamine-6-phosphate isomerase/deaminase
MGADGHTAGILLRSGAISAKTLAYGYETLQFARITMTPRAIGKFDMIILYAMGVEKKQAMENLTKELKIDIQPAQVLKSVGTFVVFTDAV